MTLNARRQKQVENFTKLSHLIWREFNETGEDIKLYEQDNHEPIVIKPGERIILPKQRQFLRLKNKYDAILYGGAAGGGKSWVGFWAVAEHLIWLYVKKGIRGARGGIFCATYNDLQVRHIDEIPLRMPKGFGKYNDQRKEYRLKAKFGGGVIKFCNLDKPEKYRSVRFAIAFIDECTENDENVYWEIKSRLRWKRGVHCPMLLATNPGGISHNFYYKEFVDPVDRRKPEYIERYKKTTKGHYFIQCLPSENPFLGDEYYLNLAQLPEKKRKALEEGDWTVFDGQFFDNLNRSLHWVEHRNPPKHWPKIRAMDLGRAHPFVCVWMTRSPKTKRIYVYREFSMTGKASDYMKMQIHRLSKGEEYELTVGSHDMWSQKGSTSGAATVAEVFNGEQKLPDGTILPSFGLVRGTKDRRQRADALLRALDYEETLVVDKDGTLRRKITRRPELYIMNNCPLTWKSLEGCLHDETDPEKIKKTNATQPGFGDDETDAVGEGLLHMVAIYEASEPQEEVQYEPERDTFHSITAPRYAKEAYSSGYSDF